MEETIHLPPTPDMFGVVLWRKCELGHWSSSGQEWMGREEEGVGEKEESLSLYKGGRNYVPPHLPGKLAYSPSAVIDENPVIRGHDLCFDKTCQENRLAICAVAG